MKQAFTIDPSFSRFFRTTCQKTVQPETIGTYVPSGWVLRNIMAYSAALFVAKTSISDSFKLMMN